MKHKPINIILAIVLGIGVLFILFVVASKTVLHNIPVAITKTPTPTMTPTITNTPIPSDTPTPTKTPTIEPTPTITLASTGLSNDLCLNLQVAINMKAETLDAKGNSVSPEYDHETNSCSYRFKEDGWLGDYIGTGMIFLSIQEQEPGMAVLNFYYKDSTERAEEILDWSAAILSVINPNTNVLAASNTIAESAKNSIAMSDRYTVFTQFDPSEMTYKIMIYDEDEVVR